jgi:hypothetical protein
MHRRADSDAVVLDLRTPGFPEKPLLQSATLLAD